MGEEWSSQAIMYIPSSHTLFSVVQAVAGVAADGRQIVNRSRDEASNYKRCYSLTSMPEILHQSFVAVTLVVNMLQPRSRSRSRSLPMCSEGFDKASIDIHTICCKMDAFWQACNNLTSWRSLPCSTYGEPIPGHVLNERIASYMHLFSMYWYLRSAPCLVTGCTHRSSC